MIESEIFRFKAFFTGHFNAVVRFVTTFTGDTDEAQDIAQETFVRLYERWDDLPTPEETRSFMYTTAHNLCISRLRHRNVEEEYTRRLLEEQADREDPRLAEEITYQETLRLLRMAIDSLPRQSRQVILLALDGKNNQETATLLGVSVNTVKTLKKAPTPSCAPSSPRSRTKKSSCCSRCWRPLASTRRELRVRRSHKTCYTTHLLLIVYPKNNITLQKVW